ncbi:MAG: GtrA family protein [Sphingobacteriales bacterium]|nr:MAG: GtrA family protein [Sphingobacteriales bacterium]TAF83657.1 MAG: GtrA family protein [Sphingobacteriales bacterium]
MIINLHRRFRQLIMAIIVWFYPPFKKIMPYQTFQYAACGGGNTVLNIFLYFVSYNYVLKKQDFNLGIVIVGSHIAAFIMAFLITFPIGLYLNMFVVFKGSFLKKRVQLFRYFLVVMVCILLNYLLLSLFVEKLKWYPTLSQIASTSLIIIFSYISQQRFSFKKSV